MAHNFRRYGAEFDSAARKHREALETPGLPDVKRREIVHARLWAERERERLERDAGDYRLEYDRAYLAYHGVLAESDPEPSAPSWTMRHTAVALLLMTTVATGCMLAKTTLGWEMEYAVGAGVVAALVLFHALWAGLQEVVGEETGKPRVKMTRLRTLCGNVLVGWVCALLVYLIRWAAAGRGAATDLVAGLLLVTLLFLSPALAAVLAEMIQVLAWGNRLARCWAACRYRIGATEEIRTLCDAVERRLPPQGEDQRPGAGRGQVGNSL